MNEPAAPPQTKLDTLPTAIPGDRLDRYLVDGEPPMAAVRPTTVEELREAVSMAHAEGTAVFPHGGGTRTALGNLPRRPGVALDTTALDRVLAHEPADLTVAVEAGVTPERLQRTLAAAGQWLPLETPAPGRATIGGMLSVGEAGPLGLAYGLPRDWLIGVRVVNAEGIVTKGGGRVVKNVTGYDMNKLYTGALGTLGVIVEAVFKLAPKPAADVTVAAGCFGLSQAIDAAGALLSQYGRPSALALVNGPAASRLGLESPQYLLLARFLGGEAVTRGRAERAEGLLRGAGCKTGPRWPGEEGAGVWQRLVDLPWVGDNRPAVSVRHSVLPSEVGALLRSLVGVDDPSCDHGLVAEVGVGTVRSLAWTDGDASSLGPWLERVVGAARRAGGSWVIERAPTALKLGRDVWGPPPPGIEVMRRLKLLMDPRGILNPGRFVGGL